MTLNAKITPDLFNGTKYKDWAYSTKMAIGRSRRLDYIDGSIKEPKKDDLKYSDWVSENILVMNWNLNSMEGGNAKSFDISTQRTNFGIPFFFFF